MNDTRPRSLPRRVLSALGRGLDQSRRVFVNVLFLAIVVGLLAAALRRGAEGPEGSRARRGPEGEPRRAGRGPLAAGPRRRARRGRHGEETLLKDVLDALAAAKDDKRISAVYLDLDEMGGAGMTVLEDAAAALRDFRKSGKKVIAAGDAFDMRGYYLAAQADEVLLNPDGSGPHRGLRPLPDLLPGGNRQARHHLERLPRRRVQVGRRALPEERHVSRGEGGRPRVAGRHLAGLPRRGLQGAQDDARGPHRATSRGCRIC